MLPSPLVLDRRSRCPCGHHPPRHAAVSGEVFAQAGSSSRGTNRGWPVPRPAPWTVVVPAAGVPGEPIPKDKVIVAGLNVPYRAQSANPQPPAAALVSQIAHATCNNESWGIGLGIPQESAGLWTGGRSGSACFDFVSPAGQPAEGAVDPLSAPEQWSPGGGLLTKRAFQIASASCGPRALSRLPWARSLRRRGGGDTAGRAGGDEEHWSLTSLPNQDDQDWRAVGAPCQKAGVSAC